MTDNISKVSPVCYCHGTDICVPCKRRYAERQKETATTPAEVDGVEVDRFDPGMCSIAGEYGGMDRNDGGDYVLYDDYATLARQLAKSERDCVELRALLTAQNAAIVRTDELARQLAEANSELAMHRADATRVAACPWRVQKGHTSECQPPKRLQDALDQLAEATRRLGEVEGLLHEWLHASDAGWTGPLIDRTKTALQKDPNKHD